MVLVSNTLRNHFEESAGFRTESLRMFSKLLADLRLMGAAVWGQ